MSNLYELIVFDWEGTLGDPLGYLLDILDKQAAEFGMGAIRRAVARQYLPHGLGLVVKKLFPNLSVSQQEELLSGIQRASQISAKEQCLFEGARQVVKDIQQAGMCLAIATNKGPQSLQKALQVTDMGAFFTVTRSAGQVPAKPCPQMLEEIMDAFSLDANQTLMIGDSVSDVEMAVSIGVECIGIDFYGQQTQLLKNAGATHVFDNYNDVGRFLKLPGYSV